MSAEDAHELSGDAKAASSPDPTDLSVRHPLHRTWTMWYDPPAKGKVSQASWQSKVKKLMDFNTVEDFWGMYNNIVPPSNVVAGANYHLFKQGVKPAWEDSENKNGGKWVLHLTQAQSSTINDMWLYTVLAMIGETFEHSDEICGAVISLRRHKNRISLWTKTADRDAVQQQIGLQWRGFLECMLPLEYQVHADALQSSSSFSNRARYMLD